MKIETFLAERAYRLAKPGSGAEDAMKMVPMRCLKNAFKQARIDGVEINYAGYAWDKTYLGFENAVSALSLMGWDKRRQCDYILPLEEWV